MTQAKRAASVVPRPTQGPKKHGHTSPEALSRLTKMVRAVEDQWHMRWRVKVGDDDRARSLAVARIMRAARLALNAKDDKKLYELSAAARFYLDQHGADFLARRTESAVGLRSLMLGWLRRTRPTHELAHLFVTVVWDRPSAIRSELARAGVSLRGEEARAHAITRVTKAFEKLVRKATDSGALAKGRRLTFAEQMVQTGLLAMGYPKRESTLLFSGG